MKNKGFTLLELLLVIAILGILATTLVVAINPGRQLAVARDQQRETDINGIIAVVQQYAAEHSGELPDTDGDPATSNFPTSLTCIGSDSACFDLANAGENPDDVVPTLISELPKDPLDGTNADTGYLIYVDSYKHLHASASGETKTITVTR